MKRSCLIQMICRRYWRVCGAITRRGSAIMSMKATGAIFVMACRSALHRRRRCCKHSPARCWSAVGAPWLNNCCGDRDSGGFRCAKNLVRFNVLIHPHWHYLRSNSSTASALCRRRPRIRDWWLDKGQWTPAPWINVIANAEFGFMVSEVGSGCTWLRQ